MPKKSKKNKQVKKKKLQKNELLIKKSLIRELIQDQGDYRIASDSFEALSDLVKDTCIEAIERAHINRRKTVQRQDF